MADPHTDETAPQPLPHSTGSASDRLREVTFPLAMRGYERHAVDEFLTELLSLVVDLESRQTREGVVQKALDELGEETAGILQRAHETADDITSRSRAQADARLKRSEREAEIARHDADEYAEQVIVDTRLLWDERQRLIEDIRQLADEVLGTADDAIERVKLPEQLGPPATAPEGDAAAEEPTAAVDPAQPPEGPEPFRLGAVAAGPDEEAPEPPDEESGHTVELEALPGGSEEPPQRD